MFFKYNFSHTLMQYYYFFEVIHILRRFRGHWHSSTFSCYIDIKENRDQNNISPSHHYTAHIEIKQIIWYSCQLQYTAFCRLIDHTYNLYCVYDTFLHQFKQARFAVNPLEKLSIFLVYIGEDLLFIIFVYRYHLLCLVMYR